MMMQARLNLAVAAEGDCAVVRLCSVLTGCGAVSLSSFGGEGQGEGVLVLDQRARCIGAAIWGNVTRNRNIAYGDGPPLPTPPLQRRRGGTIRPLLASAGY